MFLFFDFLSRFSATAADDTNIVSEMEATNPTPYNATTQDNDNNNNNNNLDRLTCRVAGKEVELGIEKIDDELRPSYK